jgi:type VI secretion system protein ImpH
LYALVGLEPKALRNSANSPREILRYAGLISQQPKSAAGLTAILRDVLGEAPVRLEQCVPRSIPVPMEQQFVLGGAGLGSDSYIGETIMDASSLVRIHVGPIGHKAFSDLLPGGETYNKLMFLTSFYVVDALDFEIVAVLETDEVQPTVLGDEEWSQLGLSTWLFSGEFTATAKVEIDSHE